MYFKGDDVERVGFDYGEIVSSDLNGLFAGGKGFVV